MDTQRHNYSLALAVRASRDVNVDLSLDGGVNDALNLAVHAFVGRAPTKILMIQLEDLLGQVEQVNVPGTTDERYPNWRRKLPKPIEQWADDEQVTALLRSLGEERGTKML